MLKHERVTTPVKCRGKFAGMPCELASGHMLQGLAHQHQEWRWNSKLQWTVTPLPIPLDAAGTRA